jgi:hypothetical protein
LVPLLAKALHDARCDGFFTARQIRELACRHAGADPKRELDGLLPPTSMIYPLN